MARLRFQAVHSDDVGQADRLAVVSEGARAFNIARRASDEVGWQPRVSALDALRDLLDGLRDRADDPGRPTPPQPAVLGGGGEREPHVCHT